MTSLLSLSERSGRRRAACVLGALSSLACLYDPDERCGPDQVATGEHGEQCACVEGFALVGLRCVPCGEHEVPGASGCVCEAGYERAAESAPCSPVEGIGAACDTAGQPCSDARFPRCEAVHGTAGYCTAEGCASGAECEGGYTCNMGQTPAFCEKPLPTGQGQPCSAPADCEGLEADLCDTFQTQTCLVQNCALAPDSCSKGYGCCPIPGFVALCLPEGQCPS